MGSTQTMGSTFFRPMDMDPLGPSGLILLFLSPSCILLKKKIALSAQVDCLRDTRQLETPDNIIKSFKVKNKGNEEHQNI